MSPKVLFMVFSKKFNALAQVQGTQADSVEVKPQFL